MNFRKHAKLALASGITVIALVNTAIADPTTTSAPTTHINVVPVLANDGLSASDSILPSSGNDSPERMSTNDFSDGQFPTPYSAPLNSGSSLRPMSIGWLDWSRWWQWAGNWRAIAENLVNQVPSSWKQYVLRNGIRGAAYGWSADAVTYYYKSQGIYCPPQPWWLPGPAKIFWAILTPAEYAR